MQHIVNFRIGAMVCAAMLAACGGGDSGTNANTPNFTVGTTTIPNTSSTSLATGTTTSSFGFSTTTSVFSVTSSTGM